MVQIFYKTSSIITMHIFYGSYKALNEQFDCLHVRLYRRIY